MANTGPNSDQLADVFKCGLAAIKRGDATFDHNTYDFVEDVELAWPIVSHEDDHVGIVFQVANGDYYAVQCHKIDADISAQIDAELKLQDIE